ncbi:glycosyltransferase [archaeon]|nr:glycosyltransferase [archaeon]
MKVSLIAPPFVEVPPKKYGGTERVLDCLGNQLINLGTNVILYASGDSESNVPLEIICDLALFNDSNYDHSEDRSKRVKKINEKTLDLLDRSSDIVNAHDYDNPDLIERLSKTGLPILVSIRHALTPLIQEVYDKFKNHTNISFQGLTGRQVKSLDSKMPFIHNGINPNIYSPIESNEERRDFFLSIGDMKPIKGHKTSINLAKKIGLDLVIAGAPYYPESVPYFEENVRPQINLDVSKNKGKFIQEVLNGTFNFGKGNIIYFGSANDEEKRILFTYSLFMQFLGNIEVEGNIEACPSTVLESIMSGTPVLGVNGAVTSELVYDGLTGLNVNNLEDAERRYYEILNLNPNEIRNIGIKDFSARTMAKNYLKLYERLLGK